MSKFDVSGFLAEFFDEANGRLQSINQKLVLFETDELDEAALTQLRRDVHTIKGSAQMLGVQDISELCHVFEDAMNYVTRADKADVLPMVQFLFDLHDSLQARLKHPDAKTRLDSALKKIKFEHIKKTLNGMISASKNKPDTGRSNKVARRKKKGKVPKNLIAAVIGGFNGSLQQKQQTAISTKSSLESEHIQSQTIKKIDFRPNVAELEMEDTGLNKNSGNFLRVDRSRLTNLSNQIVELASLRFRDDAPEQQLQSIVKDFRLLKEKLLMNQNFDASTLSSILDSHLRQIQQCSDALRYQQQRSSIMLDGVRDQVLGLMLKPLNSVFSIFPRAVRDVSKRSAKKVQLLVAGDSVEMDQVAAEALTEPLMHLVNNAIAHGIEKPEERLKCGKPEEGQITICARQKGNLIHLDVSDDGKGMDVNEIRDKAISQGVVSSSEAEDMDSSEILELIFHPGFSTQLEVTELAGRGMGLSVVLDVMHELTGNIHIHSQKGQGTCFSMVFPVSLTVQQATLFRIAKQRFAILANLIVHVMPLQQQQIKIGSGPFSKGYIKYAGHRVPVIDLRDMMSIQTTEDTATQAQVLVVEHLEGFLAMLVDEVMGETEVMVRELDPYLKHYHPIGLMGCTIIDDGTVQLLIEPNGLKEMWRTAPDAILAQSQIENDQIFHQHILLIDDSSIALNIEKKMFENMGFRVDTAISGVDALEKTALNNYELVVSDLEMPDIDGIHLIQQLRGHQHYQNTPMIIIATREVEDEKQRAFDVGVNAYIAKRQLKSNEMILLQTLSDLLPKSSKS